MESLRCDLESRREVESYLVHYEQIRFSKIFESMLEALTFQKPFLFLWQLGTAQD